MFNHLYYYLKSTCFSIICNMVPSSNCSDDASLLKLVHNDKSMSIRVPVLSIVYYVSILYTRVANATEDRA
jgi:hypothetical protein